MYLGGEGIRTIEVSRATFVVILYCVVNETFIYYYILLKREAEAEAGRS